MHCCENHWQTYKFHLILSSKNQNQINSLTNQYPVYNLVSILQELRFSKNNFQFYMTTDKFRKPQRKIFSHYFSYSNVCLALLFQVNENKWWGSYCKYTYNTDKKRIPNIYFKKNTFLVLLNLLKMKEIYSLSHSNDKFKEI